jgi:hypothetical protein
MTRRVPFPTLLLAGGSITVAGALLWWELSYWQVWGNNYLSVAESSRCLLADSSLCRLATSLCTSRHAAVIAAYSPAALWAGVGLVLSSLVPSRQRTASSIKPEQLPS